MTCGNLSETDCLFAARTIILSTAITDNNIVSCSRTNRKPVYINVETVHTNSVSLGPRCARDSVLGGFIFSVTILHSQFTHIILLLYTNK